MTDNTLDVLFPDEVEITLSGRTFKLTEFKLGQLKKISILIRDFVEPIIKLSLDSKSLTPMSALDIYIDNADKLADTLAYILGEPVEFVENLTSTEGFDLCGKIIQVNQPFFVRSVNKIVAMMAKAE
jgi:hypothetical protein